ncbi:MAG: EamA family transporter RarD [Chloroflexi bacterium]|nr:EamA family transporter RarD [Chloroflexota bacterium]
MNRGIWYAIGAYICWGLFPIYWKWLVHVPAIQLIGHRIIWSCLILIGVILVTRQWSAFRAAIQSPRALRIYFIAAIVVGVNWFVYVWGVNAGFVVETALGYFINPLISVLLGVIFLRERLRAWQWLPIGLATIGVVYLTLTYGSLPWIALTLAFSFAFYGLVKKTAPLNSLYGLALETAILFIPALLYLFFVETTGAGAFLHTGIAADLLLAGAGVATTVPLLMFASAARRIPLSLVGILQYIAPTLQFLCGVLIYREPFNQSQLIGFGFVWLALIIFAIESFAAHRAQTVAAIAE